MAKAKIPAVPTKVINLFVIAMGIVVGQVAKREVSRSGIFEPTGSQKVYEYINVYDVVFMAIGLALFFLGGKIHRLLKWFGLGMFLGEVAEKTVQFVWRT